MRAENNLKLIPVDVVGFHHGLLCMHRTNQLRDQRADVRPTRPSPYCCSTQFEVSSLWSWAIRRHPSAPHSVQSLVA
jgi:hypothetical protein